MVRYGDRPEDEEDFDSEDESDEDEEDWSGDESYEDEDDDEEGESYDEDEDEDEYDESDEREENWDTDEGSLDVDEETGEYVYTNTAFADEDGEEQKDPNQKAKNCAAILCCLFCCILLIVGVILGVVLSKEDNSPPPPPSPPSAAAAAAEPTPPPVSRPTLPPLGPVLPPVRITSSPTVSAAPTTSQPTIAPSGFPSSSPTITPAPTKSIPDELFLNPDADTFIYTRGFYVADSFGSEQTLLIQNGPEEVNEIPDAMAFLSFNLEDVPTVERIDAEGREKVAILELNHEPNTFDRSDRSYVISRGPPSPLKIETFHGELYVPQLSEWTDGPTFMVANISTGFTIDISELVFGEPSISVRQLQEGPNIPQADSNVNVNSDQLFLMIRDNGNLTDKGGDRFFSRESDTPPRLHIRLWPPGYVPPPTLEPTISPAPSTSSPPSIQPTISSGPSISASTQPTMVASATPSAEAII